MKINVVKNVLEANDTVAADNRNKMNSAGILAVNIISAPGSGKTSLLEKTIPMMGEESKSKNSAVIVGDLQTTRDAERLSDAAAQITQVNTEGGCHLSAAQVGKALDVMDMKGLSFIFIENVGNMVCPTGFDLGEHVRVAMLSTTEGDDKVAKYNTLFQPADVILLNKVDLIDMLDYDKSRVYDDIARINTRAEIIEISAKTGQGLDEWVNWLRSAAAGEKKLSPKG